MASPSKTPTPSIKVDDQDVVGGVDDEQDEKGRRGWMRDFSERHLSVGNNATQALQRSRAILLASQNLYASGTLQQIGKFRFL